MPGYKYLRGVKRSSRSVAALIFTALLFMFLLCAHPAHAQQSTPSIQSIGAQAEEMEREGRWNDAAEAYKRILAMDPKSIPALNRLGALYIRQGRFAEGKQFYREALRVDPQNFGTNLNLGIAFLKEQDYPRAAAPLQQAVAAQQVSGSRPVRPGTQFPGRRSRRAAAGQCRR